MEPEVLGSYYMQNKGVLKGVLQLLTGGGLSQEDALEVIRRSEEPQNRAKLLGAVRQVLMSQFGLSLAMADKFIDTYGHDEHSAEQMAQAIQRLPRGNRIGQTRVWLLPRQQTERKICESFLYRLSKITEMSMGDIVSITEGLKEAEKVFVETKKIPRPIFNKLAKMDPTPQKKYIMWMCKMYLTTRSVAKFEIVKKFDELVRKNQIEDKDIYNKAKYPNIEAVDDIVRKKEYELTKSQIKRGVKDFGDVPKEDIVWQTDLVTIVKPCSIEKSQMYGRGSNWCTASMGSRNYFHSYYFKQGVNLYYVFPTREDGDYADKYERMAMAVYPDGRVDGYDKHDNRMDAAAINQILWKDLQIPLPPKSKLAEE
jgi:hypothetical protein